MERSSPSLGLELALDVDAARIHDIKLLLLHIFHSTAT